MRRWWVAIVVIALTVGVQFAPTASQPAWSLGEAAKPYRGITLRMIGEALNPLASLDKQKALFEKETGIKVIIEQRAFDQVLEKTTADFAGKTGTYDLFLNPHVQLATLVTNRWVRPIDEFLKNPRLSDPQFNLEKEVISRSWLHSTSGYKGQLYGVPFSAHTIYLNWRWDVYEHPDEMKAFKAKYGYDLLSPPVTMKQLRDTAEFFTRRKGQKLAGATLAHDVYGITLAGKRHVSTLWNWYNFLYAFNGTVVDAPTGDDYGKVVVNSDAAVASLELYKELITKFAPPGSLTYTWDEQLAALQTGLAMSALLWADASYAISVDPTQSKVIGKMAYSGTPIQKRKISNLHQWSMFIPASSKHPEAAWLFLQWTQRPGIQAKLMSTGSISLSGRAYQVPEVYKIDYAPTHYFILAGKPLVVDGKPALRKRGSAWGLPSEYLNAKDPMTGKTTAEPFKLERFPEYIRMQDILQRYLSDILAGRFSPREGLNKAADEIRKAIPKLK